MCVCVCAHAALLFLIYVFVIGMFAHSKRALTTTTTTTTSPIRTPQRASSCSWRRLCRVYVYMYLCMYAAYVLLPSVVVVVYILHFVFSYPLTSVHRTFHFTSFNFSDTKTNNVLFSCYCHRLSLSLSLSVSFCV